MGTTGHRGELLRRARQCPRLAEDPAFEGNELIAPDQRGGRLLVAEAQRLGQRQALGQLARPRRAELQRVLVHPRRRGSGTARRAAPAAHRRYGDVLARTRSGTGRLLPGRQHLA